MTDEERAFYGEEDFDEDGYGDDDVYGEEDDVPEAATAASPAKLPQGASTSDGSRKLVANAALMPKAVAAAAAAAAAASSSNGNGAAAMSAAAAPAAAAHGKLAAGNGSGGSNGAAPAGKAGTGSANGKGKTAEQEAVENAPEPPRRHSWRKGLKGLRRQRDLGTGWTFSPANEEALMDAVR